MWKLVVPQRDGTAFVCPICYWTEKDVWDFHKLRNLPYCSLYDEGFTRLGCVGCPRAGNQLAEFERWPLMGRNWKRAVKAFYEKWEHVPSTKTGKTRFFVNPRGWEGYWEWWITQKWPTSCQLEFLFADVNKEEFE
jgi:phosphoadenosine phosphosulfate reductase